MEDPFSQIRSHFVNLPGFFVLRKAIVFAGAQGQKGQWHTEAIRLSVLRVLVIFEDNLNNRGDVRLRGWTVQFSATPHN